MGEAQSQVQPLQLSTGSGSTPVLKDVTASFGDPASFNVNTAFYSFSTWRLRINVAGDQTIVAAVSFTAANDGLDCTGDETNDFDCRFDGCRRVPEYAVRPVLQGSERGRRTDRSNRSIEYRCAYYRVKDMPVCATSSNGNCVAPFVGAVSPGIERHPERDSDEPDESADVGLPACRSMARNPKATRD